MIAHCPLCGKWYEFYNDFNDCSYESTTQSASPDNTIIDQWETIPTPPAPKLSSVTVDPKSTALLILDMETTICNNPHCLNSIPKIKHLITEARQCGMLIIYSLTHNGHPSDIFWEVAPLPGNPIVRSNVDKFYKTDLNNILKECGIRSVLVTGYAANGAVLHTATAAAFRGYQVIIPVDGMPAKNPYAEQYTAWHMLNSPGARDRTILTKVSMIRFGCHSYSII